MPPPTLNALGPSSYELSRDPLYIFTLVACPLSPIARAAIFLSVIDIALLVAIAGIHLL